MSEPEQERINEIAELLNHQVLVGADKVLQVRVARFIIERESALTQRAEKAEAAEADLLLRYKSLEHIIQRIDRELTDGEQGPSETIGKIADKMEEFARTPSLPPNPGSALLNEVKALREKVKEYEGMEVNEFWRKKNGLESLNENPRRGNTVA